MVYESLIGARKWTDWVHCLILWQNVEYHIQPAAVWLTGITEGPKLVTTQWNPLSQAAVHATVLCEFKRQLCSTWGTKTKSQPFAQRDSDPHTNTNSESTSQKQHSMLAPFLFPLASIYFCPIVVDFPFTALPTNERTHGKEEHGESWPQTGKRQQGGYSSVTAPSQELSNSSCTCQHPLVQN